MGYIKLLRAISKQAMMDIWEHRRMVMNGQKRKSNGYWAIKAEEYRKKEVETNYDTAKDFILKFFGEKVLNEVENGHRLRKAA